MKDEKLHIAIVGAGKAGTIHAGAFSGCGRAEVVRVVSRTRESARKLAETLPGAAYGTGLDEALDDPRVGAVVVASPDRFHHPQAAAALRRGKHVLVEKPMCRTGEEARDLIAAAREAGVVLMAGFVERAAKRLFGIPDFKYYALADGLRALFARHPGKPVAPGPRNAPRQMDLFAYDSS